MSPEQFATEAGLTPTTIRNHEQGRIARPRRSTARQMGEALSRLEKQMQENRENAQW
jgi:DNA-binding XRE family transcriptional regulator